MDFIRTHFFKNDAVGPSGADGSTSTFPLMLHTFRVKESRQSFPNELGKIKDDWGRANIQNCMLSQDHENPWNNSESSLILVIL